MPDVEVAILALEDYEEIKPHHFDRTLQSLIHQPGIEGVRGIVFGCFQRASNTDHETLAEIVRGKPELGHTLVIADASFGHTTPALTFPIGDIGTLRAHVGDPEPEIQAH